VFNFYLIVTKYIFTSTAYTIAFHTAIKFIWQTLGQMAGFVVARLILLKWQCYFFNCITPA